MKPQSSSSLPQHALRWQGGRVVHENSREALVFFHICSTAFMVTMNGKCDCLCWSLWQLPCGGTPRRSSRVIAPAASCPAMSMIGASGRIALIPIMHA